MAPLYFYGPFAAVLLFCWWYYGPRVTIALYLVCALLVGIGIHADTSDPNQAIVRGVLWPAVFYDYLNARLA